ncbi:MAG: hypothetical protein ABIU05_10375 [Nitrospirales bacterium]
MNRNKLEQLEKCTISKVGEGMAQAFNNLSHPLRFTLNQWARWIRLKEKSIV